MAFFFTLIKVLSENDIHAIGTVRVDCFGTVRVDCFGMYSKINKKDIKQSDRGTVETHYEKVAFHVFHETIMVQ